VNNLLIGGTGFIGSILGRNLIAQNQEVVSVSQSGSPPTGVKSIILDLDQRDCPQDIIDKADTIFILIGQVYRGFNTEREKQILVRLARGLQQGHGRIFYFSTALVYGNTSIKATETTPPNPVEEYAQFKLEAEVIIKEYISPERLVTLRLANIYGSPQNKGFIGFLMQKLKEPQSKISLNGDGKQMRDYVFVDDLVQAVIAITKKTKEFGVVNISTGVSYSLIQVINLLSEITRQKINYTITNSVVNETKTSLIDNIRLRNIYGYNDFISFREGLVKTLERYQNNNHDPN
jgi:UDP-glucose 4-epimerase